MSPKTEPIFIPLMALYLVLFSSYPAWGEGKSNSVHPNPVINPSGGRNCFKSLDAKDMENLGGILYLRNKTANSSSPHDYQAQVKAIDATFSGEKRAAAFAVLSMQISKVNEARLRQAMNQALHRGERNLNQYEIMQINDLVDQAKNEDTDLIALLNLKTANLRHSAEILKSKGAKLLPNGEWSFGKEFNFNEVKNNLKLKDALSAFFPREVAELSLPGRGYSLIGDRIVTKGFDINLKRSADKDVEWSWKSEGLEEHTSKTVEIIDQFTKKAEEFARMSKENGNWINVTKAGMSADIVCGLSYKDILLPGINGLANYFSADKENGMQEWERKLNEQRKVKQELGQLISDLTIHGASPETLAALRQAIFDLENKSDEELESGLKGMKHAFIGIALAPLAVLTAPLSLPAAGASTVTATIAYTGAALTVISLGTPIVMASRNIYEDVQKGDDKLCSLFKHGSIAPINAIHTLKWGAMGPILKALNPMIKPLSEILHVGESATKYALIVPASLVSGQGIYNSSIFTIESQKAIRNIEKALEASKAEGKSANTAVLEEMLKEAKDQRWLNVVSLARSSVGLMNSIDKMLAKSVSTNSETFTTNTGNGPSLTSQSITTNTGAGTTAPLSFRMQSSNSRISVVGSTNISQTVSAPDESFGKAVGTVLNSAHTIVKEEIAKEQKIEKVEEVNKKVEIMEAPSAEDLSINPASKELNPSVPLVLPEP